MRIAKVLLGLLVGSMLLAPTPGSVGGCDSTDPLSDPEQFCIDRRAHEVARTYARGEYGLLKPTPTSPDGPAEMMRDAARAQILSRCANTAWPPGCAPTVRQTDLCLAALRDPTRIRNEANDAITECRTEVICGAAQMSLLLNAPDKQPEEEPPPQDQENTAEENFAP